MAELTIRKEVTKKAQCKAGNFYDVQWFAISGRITAMTAIDFEKAMNQALRESVFITINLADVTLLTSVGIRVVLKTYKQCDALGGKFIIEDASQPVQNVLGLSALEQMMK